MAGLRALRLEVFVREQGVSEEEELDALDQAALHAVALFQASSYGSTVLREWTVIRNQNALKPPPKALLEGLVSLNKTI